MEKKIELKKEENYGIMRALQTNKITELAQAMLPLKKYTDFEVEIIDPNFTRRKLYLRAKVIKDEIMEFDKKQKKLFDWVK